MTPACCASPVDAHVADVAVAAQEIEQRQQRQAEYGEVVALDPREELHAEPFEPIGADRAEDVRAGRIEIGVEERVAEIAHVEGGAVDDMPQPLAAAHDATAESARGASAAQGPSWRARLRAVGGLVEPGAVALQHLVGADDERIGVAAGDAQRLRLGERVGAFGDGRGARRGTRP